MSDIEGIDTEGEAQGTGDDTVNCGICGDKLSLVSIAQHLVDKHEFHDSIFNAIANAPIIDRTRSTVDARLAAGIELAEMVVKLGRFVPDVVLIAAEDLLTLGGGDQDGEFDE